MANILLQIFLYLNVFIIGALVVIAAQHANAHFRPAKHEPENPQPAPTNEPLPAAVKEHLLQVSQDQFQTTLHHSINHLQHNLDDTTEQINNLIKRLATEVVSSELEHYRTNLARLHEQAEKDLGGIKQEVDAYQTELRAQVAQELETEKQRLIKQIDTKLADAVGSFLLETLQHNVDLGSQAAYLTAMLEEHKADFIQEVADEAQPAS
jgi:DNA anti-recombination protein RmuC